MADTTAGTLSGTLMKQYWNEKFLSELRSNLVLRDLGLMGKVPAGQGVVVHWLSMADLSLHTTAMTDGTDPTAFTLSGGDKTAQLQPYGDAIKMGRLLSKTWISGSMDQVLDKLARHAANKLDRVVRDSILTGGGMWVKNSIVTSVELRSTIIQSSTQQMTVALARKARAKLEQANTQPHTDGFFVAVAHPDILYDIEGDTTNWRDVIKYDSRTFQNVIKGEVGEIHKIRFIKTTEAFNSAMGSTYGGAAKTVYQTYVLGNEAFGISEIEDVDIVVKDPSPASNVNGYSTAGYFFSFACRALEASAFAKIEAVSSLNA